MAERSWTPHDGLFRGVFARPRCARALLAAALPPWLRAALDLSTLRVVRGDAPDELRPGASDLVFEVRPHDCPRPLLLLLEHQRTQQRRFPQRAARDALRNREAFRSARGWTPTVVPVLVHQGRARWRLPLRLADQEELPPALRRRIGRRSLDLEVELFDLARCSAAALAATPGPRLAGLALALLRGAAESADGALVVIERLAPRFRALGRQPDDLALVLKYTLETVEFEPAEVEQRLQAALGARARQGVKTAAEQLEARGEARGEAKGQRAIVEKLLVARFGPLPAAVRRRLAKATTKRLEAWGVRLLEAASLEEVLGGSRRRRSTRAR